MVANLPAAVMPSPDSDLFTEIMSTPHGVTLNEGWQEALTTYENKRLTKFLESMDRPESFPSLTLAALKVGLALSLPALMRMLARIEALDWNPSWSTNPVPRLSAQRVVNVTNDFRTDLAKVVVKRWVKDTGVNDLRFPGVEGRTIHAWVLEWLEEDVLQESVHELCLRLIRADKMTWTEEVFDIAQHAVHVTSKVDSKNFKRYSEWAEMFVALNCVARFRMIDGKHRGVKDPARAFYPLVAKDFQIKESHFEDLIARLNERIWTNPTSMPALKKIIAWSDKEAHVLNEDLNERAAALLGENAGVVEALRFARKFCVPGPVNRMMDAIKKNKFRESGEEEFMGLEGQEAWMQHAIDCARIECSIVGASQLTRIAGHVALDLGVAVSAKSLTALMKEQPGYCEIGEEGWFLMTGSSDSNASQRIKKVLSVNAGPVHLQALFNALHHDYHWYGKCKLIGVMPPPISVLRDMLNNWGWIKDNGNNYFESKQLIDPEKILSPHELQIFQLLKIEGNVDYKSFCN